MSIFYDNITKQFIAKYGWHWDLKLDKDCPDPTPEAWQNIMDHTGVPEAEVILRNVYYADLRKVSSPP